MSVLGSFYRNLALTPACFLRGRHYIQRFRFLQGSQWWSADELQAFQWAELKQLLSYLGGFDITVCATARLCIELGLGLSQLCKQRVRTSDDLVANQADAIAGFLPILHR